MIYNIISCIPENILKILLYTFNWFLITNIIPEQWCEFNIVPIIKPNKPTHEIQSYRLTVLSNCFRKIFEKLIDTVIEYTFTWKKNRWPKSQYGFKKGHSTLNNLALFYTEILIAFHRYSIWDAIFIDIQQAYDDIWPDIVTNCLKFYNIPKQIMLTIYTLITRRKIYLSNSNDHLECRYSSTGLPQGSSLSPLFFTLYVGGLESEIIQYCRITQFADDIS